MTEKKILDVNGKILYRTEQVGDQIKVYDKAGRLLGWCRDGKTFNKRGEIVARTESPGVLA